MARAVVYALLACAFVVFMIFSPTKQHGVRTHQTLSRRVGYKFPIPTFDPLVAKMQRLEEQRGSPREASPTNSDRNNYAAKSLHSEDSFVDESRLNITLRLLVLFPLLDKAPKDGMVSFEELKAWNMEQAMDRLAYRTQKEMVQLDRDGDGAISFSEYLPQFSPGDIEENVMGHGEAGWWKEQFTNADTDKNGILKFEEFSNFLHPEDSSNPEIQKWVLREKIKRMDDDLDGKLNFSEFSKYAYDSYKGYAEFDTIITKPCITAQDKFAELDINNDTLLTADELIPMLPYLKPGELSYAKYYTNYLIREADDDGDGNLTLDEMLNHEYTFYSTVYNEDDYDLHDEL